MFKCVMGRLQAVVAPLHLLICDTWKHLIDSVYICYVDFKVKNWVTFSRICKWYYYFTFFLEVISNMSHCLIQINLISKCICINCKTTYLFSNAKKTKKNKRIIFSIQKHSCELEEGNNSSFFFLFRNVILTVTAFLIRNIWRFWELVLLLEYFCDEERMMENAGNYVFLSYFFHIIVYYWPYFIVKKIVELKRTNISHDVISS